MSKFLIAGLGNIGADYEGTRHNIGFDVVDALVKKHNGLYHAARLAAVAELKWKGRILVCIKPTTFMNLSGVAVKYWMDKEKVPLENLLVIVDDLAIPIDKFRLRPSGSDAGHNGLKSIQEVLGTTNYPRLRFGIGNEYRRGTQVDYVLGKWKPEELPLIEHKVDKAVEIIETVVFSGMERAMNQYNKLVVAL